jgi:transcriptional regulator with PAS, ATPase and Fis domain
MLHRAAKVAKTDGTVLIRGESGVGKEILAAAIHHAGKRKNKPMVRVNCAAIPESLLESELYGYEEGAFTGARRGGKPGKFELANGGTLFLDEIGDLSPGLQAKLLRAIQDKEIERLGGVRPIRTDVRIIAATNQDLEKKMEEKTFRQDLYYRLNAFPIHIPPLRERKDDLILLTDHFLAKFCKKYGKESGFANSALQVLIHHSWPGNVRELENVVEHAVIFCDGPVIQTRDLPAYLQNLPGNDTAGNHPILGTLAERELNLPNLFAQVEKKAIEEALRKAGKNRSAAIRLLGISRATFYSKLKRHFPEISF